MGHAAELSTLRTILEGREFFVPHYQRGYAWKQEHWLALWNDLENLVRLDAKSHFVGMLMLRTDAGRAEVVDGQQRLTTVMILANSLREAAGMVPARYALTFVENEDLQNHFDFHALGQASAASRLSPDLSSSYARNIRNAARFYGDKAKALDGKQAREYLDVLLTRFHLFALEVSANFDIHIAFETLNNRGLQLSKMELLKNRLIYLCSVLPDDDGLAGAAMKRNIHKAWRSIYAALGRINEGVTDDDAFLDAHATVFYGRVREKNWLRSKLFDTEFSTQNTSLRLRDIDSYIRSLETASIWWSHIHQPRQLPPNVQKAMLRVNQAQFSNAKPLLLAAFMRVGRDRRGAIANPAEHVDLFEPVVELMRQIERFAVIVFRLLGNQATRGRADLDSCAFCLLEPGRRDPSDVPGLSRLETKAAIRLVSDYFRAWVTNPPDEDRAANKGDSRFDWEGAFDSESVCKVVDRRFRENNGYYGWYFTRIALFEYEEAFRREGHAPMKITWEQFSFDETVEHIFPQTKDAAGAWDSAVPIDGRSDRSGRLRRALVNSLGNLLFLSRPDNSSAANNAYTGSAACKRDRYAKNGYSASQVARIFEKRWDALTIAARGIAILKRCETRWEFELVDDPECYMAYLPLLFGPEHSSVAAGKAGRKITQRTLKPVVDRLLADFGR